MTALPLHLCGRTFPCNLWSDVV